MTNKNSHDLTDNPESIPSSRATRVDGAEVPSPSIALSDVNNWRWLFLVGIMFLPFAVWAGFIIATHEVKIVNTPLDYVGLGLSVVAGLCCLWQLPIGRLSRFVMSVVFFPIISFLLFDFTFWFIGFKYGQWL
jgi:hypothetical protein